METLQTTNLICENGDLVVCVGLNRPDKANAMNAKMQEELTELFLNVGAKTRAVVLYGSGKHFCAGADLEWMQASGKMSAEENLKESKKLSRMYAAIALVDCPTIAVVKGSVMGGGVGLMAACDFAFALEKTKFCLSEARLGILPAIILPYLQKSLSEKKLARLTLSSQVFSSQEALGFGILDAVCSSEQVGQNILAKINEILLCSPSTKKNFEELANHLQSSKVSTLAEKQEICESAISTVRSSEEGQDGLQSFLSKKPASWVTTLDQKEWSKISLTLG